MANLNFTCCSSCAKCCHDLRLPLTRLEAINWLLRGDTVEIMCEALPWLEEPDASNLQAQHKRRRSFAAMSGDLPIRVVVILTAVHSGACPNLDAQMRCTIYETRPHVCRVYPAEINPFIMLSPSSKLCPSVAWTSSTPLMRDGSIVDEEVRLHIAQSRCEDEREALWKKTLCANLGVGSAGLANEGFAVHAPPLEHLLEALRQDRKEDDREACPAWTLVSNQAGSVNALASVGARARLTSKAATGPIRYIGFRTDAADT